MATKLLDLFQFVRPTSSSILPHLISPRPALQFSSRQGALAQYVTLPKDNITVKPLRLTWEESAAIPLAALTAVQALRLGGYDPARALLPRGPAPTAARQGSIFINGGSTAVGLYAIQLAKALSLHVTVSASPRNESFVRLVGADAFLDYTVQPIVEQLCANPPNPRFDMVLDAVGSLDPALYIKSRAYVKKRGAYVTTGPWPDQGGCLGLFGKWVCPILRRASLGGVPTAWKCVAFKFVPSRLTNVDDILPVFRAVSVVNKKEDMKLLCTLIERGGLSDLRARYPCLVWTCR